jgi:hypothetical protein
MVCSMHMAVCCILGLVLCVLAGCQRGSSYTPMAGSYYLNPTADLSSLGRVALVELDNGSSYPEIAKNATDAIYVGLQKKQHFGLTSIAQDEEIWRSLQSDSDSSYMPEQLLEMRNVLKCDAVLTGAVTQYEPYPHMSIGMRMRLIDLRNGALLWAVEQVWDSADKGVSQRIKQYLKSQKDSGSGSEELVAMSSLKFLKFVGYEIAETLRAAQESSSP